MSSSIRSLRLSLEESVTKLEQGWAEQQKWQDEKQALSLSLQQQARELGLQHSLNALPVHLDKQESMNTMARAPPVSLCWPHPFLIASFAARACCCSRITLKAICNC